MCLPIFFKNPRSINLTRAINLGNQSVCITGTFNHWSFDSLENDDQFPGLYKTAVTLGYRGVNIFRTIWIFYCNNV